MKPSNHNLIHILLMGFMTVACNAQIQKNLTSYQENVTLKKQFKEDFFVGAAINEEQISEIDKDAVAIIKNEFNTISPENVMKWMYVHPQPNNFYFDHADKYVKFGLDNNMHIVGHALIWHAQIADFMNAEKDSTKMMYYLEQHIKTMVSRYRGKINTWDVVNEALNEDGTLRETIFSNIIGEKYLEHAFKLAEKYDANVDLVYNDYNLCEPLKRNGAIKLIQSLQKCGAKIDGVGIQAHWQLTKPTLEDIEASILSFSDLGIKVMFTELDISVLPNPWELNGAEVSQNFEKLEGNKKMNPYPNGLPEDVNIQLAKRYEDIFELFLKHKDKISRITFWGVTDQFSWLNDWPIKGRTNYPLLFDRNYESKKAYQRLIHLNK